ncbi:helix-turn-helix domain-containing protein [Candidatus Woesearchaeota archaeon]|nr:helix-turn-helix domain-containing protein [Candidatus Woesearchaeota archaeon]MBT4151218.1 helix-turn-helix domain-containing protein [Candidatus Woesearchaeota archaeon]MBT4247660.1 helix-turn-helix domain-containing protein [Candidatus Woesearchaeota archaeon]MBT4434375.1 helix-turn-helix domain-containing protein [Candidatus Woesearchaeota archaeon]MBT7331738.1 helix-turn-helix domain-containing protein [Candidatus Woesearchaeota archaeon]
MPKGVLKSLLDHKKAAVLRVVLSTNEEMYLSEIAELSGVSTASTFRILRELVDLEILEKKEWKTSKIYSSLKNPKVDFLKGLFADEYDGLQDFVKAMEDVKGISQIILHGKQKQGKANVLLIGQHIEVGKVDVVAKAIAKKGFEISYLTLGMNQYTQMAKMGLYSEEKKVLKG